MTGNTHVLAATYSTPFLEQNGDTQSQFDQCFYSRFGFVSRSKRNKKVQVNGTSLESFAKLCYSRSTFLSIFLLRLFEAYTLSIEHQFSQHSAHPVFVQNEISNQTTKQ